MSHSVDGFKTGTAAASLEDSYEFYFGKRNQPMDRYRARINAENLKNQAKPVQAKAKEILSTLEEFQRYLYWAIEPDQAEEPVYWAANMIQHAHALVDMGHEYRQTLAANPPPKVEEEIEQ